MCRLFCVMVSYFLPVLMARFAIAFTSVPVHSCRLPACFFVFFPLFIKAVEDFVIEIYRVAFFHRRLEQSLGAFFCDKHRGAVEVERGRAVRRLYGDHAPFLGLGRPDEDDAGLPEPSAFVAGQRVDDAAHGHLVVLFVDLAAYGYLVLVLAAVKADRHRGVQPVLRAYGY